jgi:beta-hydroxylase
MKKVIEKPKHLQNPRRAFVKRNGKKLVRKIASFQSRQSIVPDSPKIDNKYFPFLKSFTDNWLDIKEEALEVMKFKEVIPGFKIFHQTNIVWQQKITGKLLFCLDLARG